MHAPASFPVTTLPHCPFTAPDAWPALRDWVTLSRENALHLFPAEAYSALHLRHQLIWQRLSLVNDPAAIKHICATNAKNYRLTNLHKRMLTPSLGGGLIVAEGASWQQQRRSALQRAHPRRYSMHHNAATARIDQTLSGWSNGKPRHIMDDLSLLSIDLIAQTFFGHHAPVATPAMLTMITNHRRIIEHIDWLDVLGVHPRLASGKMRRAHKVAHALDAEIRRTIAAWKRTHQTETASASYDERDFAVSMFAGFESIAVTCHWACMLLSHHPDLQARIRRESLTPDELSQPMQRCQGVTGKNTLLCVLLETMRLYPPLPLIYRQACRADTLPSGMHVRRREIVCMSPWLLHRHRQHWDHPDHFLPQRWETRHDYPAYMPFGIGARQCIGMRMGLSLCMMIMKQLLDRYHIDMQPRSMTPPRAGISLRTATPVAFQFSPANESAR